MSPRRSRQKKARKQGVRKSKWDTVSKAMQGNGEVGRTREIHGYISKAMQGLGSARQINAGDVYERQGKGRLGRARQIKGWVCKQVK